MHKSWLIIWREYRTRVAKRSFLLMSIIGPMIMAAVIVFAFWVSLEESEDQKILVCDASYPAFRQLEDRDKIDYEVMDLSLEKGLALLEASDYTSVLFLPSNILGAGAAELYFKKQPSVRIQRSIEQDIQEYIEIRKLHNYNISKTDYFSLKQKVVINTFKLDESGQTSETTILAAIVGLVFAVLIYFFIFMYSVQVMRGVVEEKTNRIVEVMVSSVKPFQLMLGKILGVGAVGLTQFILWTVLTFIIASAGQYLIIGERYNAENVAEKVQMTNQVMNQVNEENAVDEVVLNDTDSLFSKIQQINFPLMLSVFLFYFLGGYFLYSALMAAVGSVVDAETDTQQFVLPITFPLILSYVVAFSIFENPSSELGVWMSIIPFTSPVIMMIRVAFGIESGDLWQLYLSMALLVVTFLFTTWIAGRIYRTGILMYGKKATLKEIFRWIKH